jgi:hypothetical protein
MLAGGPGPLTAILSLDWLLLVATIFVGATALSALSVWLPRGDAVDNSGALAFMAGAFLAPQLSALMMALGWLFGMVLSGRGIELWRALEQMSRRALLMAATYAGLGFALRALHGGVLVEVGPGRVVPLRTLETGAALVRALGPGFGTLSTNTTVLLLVVGLAGVGFIALDLLLEQLQSAIRLSTPYSLLIASTVQLRGWMVVAEMSVAVLTVLVYPTLDIWGVTISIGMLIVMRRSFVLLRDMQTSYGLTIQVLARSMEWSDAARRGHAERVANMVAEAVRRIGFSQKRRENARYAALFHDVARMGADDSVSEVDRTSSAVLAEVNVLSGAMPVLRMLDSAGRVEESPDEEDVIAAYLIARFSDIDTAVNIHEPANPEQSNAIGTRLYASTRASVERIIRDVERSAPSLLRELSVSEDAPE